MPKKIKNAKIKEEILGNEIENEVEDEIEDSETDETEDEIEEIEVEQEEELEAPKATKPTKRLSKKLNTNRPIYLYDFNGTLVGRFRGPTDAAKRLLGYGRNNSNIHDSHKIASLRSELSTYARSNCNSRSGVVFVQGYVPSYEELTPDDIVNNRKNQNTRGNKVLQYDFNGNLVNIFENANDAAEKLGKSTAWISILCNANFILRYDR